MIHLDARLFDLIYHGYRSPALTWWMEAVSQKWNWLIPAALFLVWTSWRGRRRAVLLVLSTLIVVLLADWSANTLKGIVQRPRPGVTMGEMQWMGFRPTYFSFPSSHATNAFAVISLWAIYEPQLAIPMCAPGILVCYSRIYLGDHYPLDVAGGALLGCALGFGVGMLGGWFARRRGFEIRPSRIGLQSRSQD